MSELTVILKDDHRTYREKFLLYEIFSVTDEDATIKNCINEAMKNFDGNPESITVKISLVIQ